MIGALVPFTLLAVALCWCDIRWLCIPHILVMPGILVGIILRIATGHAEPITVILEMGICLAGGILLFAAARGGLGWGDVLLALLATASFGLSTAVQAAWIAVPAAALPAAILLSAGRIGRKTPLPWAPFYLGSVVLVMLL